MVDTCYSPAFQHLIAEERRLHVLLEGSRAVAASFAAWERHHRYTAAAVNQGGAILDVGCANGFLLRCLQEWCRHRLEPYGIDVDAARLAQVSLVFPDRLDRFAPSDVQALVHRTRSRRGERMAAFPRRFRLIYWGVGDTIALAEPDWREVLPGLQRQLHPGGRLILGFQHPDRARNLRRIDELVGQGHRLDGVARNPDGAGVVVCLDRRIW